MDVVRLSKGQKNRPDGVKIQYSTEGDVLSEEMKAGGYSSEDLPAHLIGLRLNPTWVELLMGFPKEWTELPIGREEFRELKRTHGTEQTDSDASATRSFRKWLNMSDDVSLSSTERSEGSEHT